MGTLADIGQVEQRSNTKISVTKKQFREQKQTIANFVRNAAQTMDMHSRLEGAVSKTAVESNRAFEYHTCLIHGGKRYTTDGSYQLAKMSLPVTAGKNESFVVLKAFR